LAFPEAFVPDMNPRIHTLTLTGIPRRSEKKLLEKLLHFLDLAHQQEVIIRTSTASDSRRGSNMLPGLRRLCLEFDPDVVEEDASLSLSNDFDAGKLMSDADQGFSFFEDQWEPSPEFKRWKEEGADASTLPSHDACRVKSEVTPEWTGRLTHHPFDTLPPGEEHVTHSLVWYGKDVMIPVWVGSGEMTSSKAVNLYMQYLRPSSMFDPEPASPAHVGAGVPAESYIFPHAWNAIMLPASIEKPSKRQLESMTDVIASLKTTRRRGKAIYEESLARSNGDVTKAMEASSYWTGQLTMVFAPRTPRYSTAHPWR
ncbi:MAG: hypothetical protein OK454_10445, partial [Thaumarchaeota archaeon]|nr:hypothetical protein [Nitrososphaerota archaeon]